MAYILESECIKCGSCKDICPVKAIRQGKNSYIITSECISCNQCVEACPLEAIIAQ